MGQLTVQHLLDLVLLELLNSTRQLAYNLHCQTGDIRCPGDRWLRVRTGIRHPPQPRGKGKLLVCRLERLREQRGVCTEWGVADGRASKPQLDDALPSGKRTSTANWFTSQLDIGAWLRDCRGTLCTKFYGCLSVARLRNCKSRCRCEARQRREPAMWCGRQSASMEVRKSDSDHDATPCGARPSVLAGKGRYTPCLQATTCL